MMGFPDVEAQIIAVEQESHEFVHFNEVEERLNQRFFLASLLFLFPKKMARFCSPKQP